MEWLYSKREFRRIKRVGKRHKVSYQVWSTGWFPRPLFWGLAPNDDFLNFLDEKEW